MYSMNFIHTLKYKNIVACFIHEETEHKIAISLPSSSLLAKLFNEKTYFRNDQVFEKSVFGDRCLIKYREKIPPISVMRSDLFVVGSETAGLCRMISKRKSTSLFLIIIFL